MNNWLHKLKCFILCPGRVNSDLGIVEIHRDSCSQSTSLFENGRWRRL